MSKPFKTLDEQISILKSRGLIIPDEEAAKLSLLCNNYYNVIKNIMLMLRIFKWMRWRDNVIVMH